VIGFSRARFSRDGLTAYFGTAILGQSSTNEYSYLYAVTAMAGGNGSISLSQSTLWRSRVASFYVANANPGETAYVYATRQGLGAGPCYTEYGGLCLDILGPVRLVGSAVADASGTAVVQRWIPGRAPLIEVYTQAVVARGTAGSASVKSNTVTASIVP
jgi:hypothetical protein